jgi:hypothetical protein
LIKWPKQYYSSLKPKTVSEVCDSPVCSLSRFRKEAGDEKATSILILILNDVIDFFNVNNTMNGNQVLITAEMILDEYGYLKIDDFKLCFNRAKRGLFGPVYRMDGNVILSWIETYINDRIHTISEINYAQHVSIKANEKRSISFIELIGKETIRKK